MTTRSTKLTSLPAIPSGLSPDMRRFFEGVSESMQVMQGQRGDKLDRVLRARDFQPNSLFGTAIRNMISDGVADGIRPSTDPLSAPTNFQAISAFGSVLLVWDYNRSPEYGRTEIFRASVALDENGALSGPVPEFSENFAYGSISGDRINDSIAEGYRFFYWVRHINRAGVPSAFTGPATAESSPLPSVIIDRIQTEINADPFINSISSTIEANIIDPRLQQAYSDFEYADGLISDSLTAVDSRVTTLGNSIDSWQGVIDGHTTSISSLTSSTQTNASEITRVDGVSVSNALAVQRLGSYDLAAGKYSFIKTLEQTDAASSQRLDQLETSNGVNTSEITRLDSVSESNALAVQRLGTYDLAAGKYSFIKTLEQTDATASRRLDSLETSDGVNTSEITRLDSVSSANALAVQRLGTYDLAAGKYSFIKTLEQTDATASQRLDQLETSDGVNTSAITTLTNTTNAQASKLTQLETVELMLPTSLVSEKWWVPGTTGTQGTQFPVQNGAKNSIVTGLGPYGVSTRLWKGVSGGANGADGGFHTEFVNIDPTKTYRFTCWVRVAPTNTAGSIYLGCGSSPANVKTLAGVSSGNPYFYVGTHARLSQYIGEWLLMVGVIHPHDYTGGDTGLAGLYDPLQNLRIASGTEFKADPAATKYYLRAYQYYAGASTNETVYFAHPRLEVMDSTSPSFDDIIKASYQGSFIRNIQKTTKTSAEITSLISTAKGEAIASALSSAQTYTDSKTGELKSEYVLKVDVNGNVAGFGLLATANSGTKIAFAADQITFVNPQGGDQNLGLGLQIKDNSLYFDNAVARRISVEEITFKRGIGVDLSVIDNLQLPFGKITESNLAPDFLNRILLRDPNAQTTGGNETIIRSIDLDNQSAAIGSSITNAINGGGDLTRINISISLDYHNIYVGSVAPANPGTPIIDFRLKRGTTSIPIPQSAINVANLNDAKYQIAAYGSGYRATGFALVDPGEPTGNGNERIYDTSSRLILQLSFDAGYFTGSEGFTLEILSVSGTKAKGQFAVNVFESMASTDGIVVNLGWDDIADKPATATRWPTLGEIGAAASSHNHDASAITTGTLSTARGGTGRTDGKAVALATARTINGATFDGSSNIFFTSTDSTNTRIVNPEGGMYTTQASAVVGAMAIQLPVGMTNRMLRIRVRVFEYKTNESFDIELSGYNYSNGQAWYNPTAIAIGDPDVDRRYSVRFGYDSTADRAIIYIGELNTSWDYPQVAVTDVFVGYSSGGTVWRSGWSIFFETTAFKSVTYTGSLKQVGFGDTIASASTLAKRDASGNLSANSFIGNLTGTADIANQLMIWNGAGQLRTELSASNYIKWRFGGDSSSLLGFVLTDFDTTKMVFDRQGRISFGGTFSAGSPTIDSGVGAIGFWPNGAGGGQYKFLNTEMYYPSGMDLRMIATAQNGVGFYTVSGAARQTMMFGSVLISSAYGSAERAKIPANGLFVQGAITTEGKVTAPLLTVSGESQLGTRQKRMVVETSIPSANSGVFRTWIRLGAATTGFGVVTLRIAVQSNYNWANASGYLEFVFTGNSTTSTLGAYSWELTNANGNAADTVRIGMPEYRNGDFGFWVYATNTNTFTVTVDAHAATTTLPSMTLTEGAIETGVAFPAEVPNIARSGVQTLTGRGYSWTNGSTLGNPETGGFSLDSPLSTFTYLKLNSNGVWRGSLYASASGIGLVDNTGNWALRADMSRNLYTYGALRIGSGFDVQFIDATARLYRNGSGRITADVGGTADVFEITNYGIYLPSTSSSISLYVESGAEFRSTIRIGNGAAGGTISSTGLATFKAPVRGTAYASTTYNFQNAGLRALANAATDGSFISAITLASSTTEDYGWSLAAYRNSSSAGRLSFRFHVGSNAGNEIAYMNHIGQLFVTDLQSTSDRRLKTEIDPISNALEKLVTFLNGYTFTRKGTDERTGGLMADEVLEAMPEAIKENVATGYMSVNYNAVLGLVVEALKEIVDEVKSLGGFKWLQ